MSHENPPLPPTSGGNATTVLILGILGLMGGMGQCCCCLSQIVALCAPIAWILGHKELRAIREGRAPASGSGNAQAGMVCGIIGTVFLALYLIFLIGYIAFVGFAVAFDTLKSGGVPIQG